MQIYQKITTRVKLSLYMATLEKLDRENRKNKRNLEDTGGVFYSVISEEDVLTQASMDQSNRKSKQTKKAPFFFHLQQQDTPIFLENTFAKEIKPQNILREQQISRKKTETNKEVSWYEVSEARFTTENQSSLAEDRHLTGHSSNPFVDYQQCDSKAVLPFSLLREQERSQMVAILAEELSKELSKL